MKRGERIGQKTKVESARDKETKHMQERRRETEGCQWGCGSRKRCWCGTPRGKKL